MEAGNKTFDRELFSAGYQLDLSTDAFGTLRCSNDIIGNFEALHDRIESDGYLYFRDFLDTGQIDEARRVIVQRLDGMGYLDPASSSSKEAIPKNGVAASVGPEIATKDNPALHRTSHEGILINFFSLFFGDLVRYFEYTWFRCLFPGRGTRPHCDLVYMGRGSKRLYTAWIPLGDVPMEAGGLMILENSVRKRDKIKNYLERDVDEYCIDDPDAADFASGRKSLTWDGALADNPVILREKLGGRWLSADFKTGDVVIFEMQTVHGSLDNRSHKIRLSIDCRYQPMSEPIDERWIGKNPVARGIAGRRSRIC